MKRVQRFVGLDLHTAMVRVCVEDEAGQMLSNTPVPNDLAAIVAAGARHGPVTAAAVEACTGAATLADELATRAGWKVHLAHPASVARMRRGTDKTDHGDARTLADLLRAGYLPRVWLAPEPVRRLRTLVRHRMQLVERRRATKLRIGALLRDRRVRGPAGKWSLAWLSWLSATDQLRGSDRFIIDDHLSELRDLEGRLEATERRLEEETRDDPVVRRLRTEPGIGPVTSWMLRAEVGRFERFATGKQLARFCGLSPQNHSSADRQSDRGLVRAANPALRATLIEAAHRLIWREERWKTLAADLQRRGRRKTEAVAAVANRWIRGLYHRMKDPAGRNDPPAIAA